MSQRRDDIAEVERNLRLAPNCHAPTCACVPPDAWSWTGAECDCGRDALDRLVADDYATKGKEA